MTIDFKCDSCGSHQVPAVSLLFNDAFLERLDEKLKEKYESGTMDLCMFCLDDLYSAWEEKYPEREFGEFQTLLHSLLTSQTLWR